MQQGGCGRKKKSSNRDNAARAARAINMKQADGN
jgi:hypothetical protein